MKQIALIVQDDGKFLVGEEQDKEKVVSLANSVEVRTLDAAMAIVRDLADDNEDAKAEILAGYSKVAKGAKPTPPGTEAKAAQKMAGGNKEAERARMEEAFQAAAK